MPAERGVVLTWRSLHLVNGAVRRALDVRLLAEAGCSLLEHDLLAWLATAPQRRLQMLTLADMLCVTRGGLTRIVDRLVERGWVERDRPASNRREVYAVLTSDGQHAIEHARAIYLSVLKETLGAHLSKADLNELARITTKLHDALADRGPRDVCGDEILTRATPRPPLARSPRVGHRAGAQTGSNGGRTGR